MLQYQRSLQMMPPQGHFTGPVYNASPPHGDLQLSASPPPPSPSHIYDPLSPNISGSDTGPYRSHSRGSNSSAESPPSSRGHSFANRGSVRYNPTPSPTSTSSRRSRGRSISDEEDPMMGVSLAEHLANTRKEATRRQRIEAEQRRRDELRDGYARLKDVLPVSNQKSSKVSLLERGLCLESARVPSILTPFLQLPTTSCTSRSRTMRCSNVSPRQRWKCRDSALSTRKYPSAVPSRPRTTLWTNGPSPLPQTTDHPSTSGITSLRSAARTLHRRIRAHQHPSRTIDSPADSHPQHKLSQPICVFYCPLSSFIAANRSPSISRCIYTFILWARTRVKDRGECRWVCPVSASTFDQSLG